MEKTSTWRKSSKFSFLSFVPVSFFWAGRDYLESGCHGVRVPSGLLGFACLWVDQQGTLAAHIYGLWVGRGMVVIGGWIRNSGVHTNSLGQCLVTD